MVSIQTQQLRSLIDEFKRKWRRNRHGSDDDDTYQQQKQEAVLILIETAKNILESKDGDGKARKYTGRCLLHRYVIFGDTFIKVIQLLIEADNDLVYEKGAIYSFPIHVVCEQRNASVEIVKLLLKHDIENKTIYVKSKLKKALPLHFACKYNNSSIEIIQLLLKQDDDAKKKTLFEKDLERNLPFHIACKNNASIDVIRLLLRYHVIVKMEGYIRDIPFYRSKVDEFLSTNPWINVDDNTILDKKVEEFAAYCNLIESTSILELTLQRNGVSNGMELIMNQTLDFLIGRGTKKKERA